MNFKPVYKPSSKNHAANMHNKRIMHDGENDKHLNADKSDRSDNNKQTPGQFANERADKLRSAMSGLGTDENVLIQVLTRVKPRDAALLQASYKANFKRDLADDLKSDLSGDFEQIMLELIKSPARHDADLVYKAIKGFGTDEKLLIEVICTRDDAAIRAMCEEYKRVYDMNMRDAIADDVGKHLRAALLRVIDTAHGEGRLAPSDKEVPEFARRLHEAATEEVFIDICTGNTRDFLTKVSRFYARNYDGKSLDKLISKKLSGDLKRCMHALITPSEEMFAWRLHKAMKGFFGTDEDAVIRIVAGQRDSLKEIDTYYLSRFDKDLAAHVDDEFSGNAGKALVSIIKNFDRIEYIRGKHDSNSTHNIRTTHDGNSDSSMSSSVSSVSSESSVSDE